VAGYDRTVEWARSILHEGNKLKENFYTTKSMIFLTGLSILEMIFPPSFFYWMKYLLIHLLFKAKVEGPI
jgi:hypothetical protein